MSLVWALLASLLLAVTVPTVATSAPEGADKVRPEVQQQLAEKGVADFWIRFTDRPDLTPFSDISDWGARGQAVYDALEASARQSQGPAIALLQAQGVAYEPFIVTNAIRVTGGSTDLVQTLTSSARVEGIYPPIRVTAPELDPSPDAVPAVDGVEWGIADINADDVWSQYGVFGEGIVVGTIDSGAEFDHPALVEHYRGNDGDGTFTHDYNWFDAGGLGSDEPVDLEGHGTHVMGTMVGDDGGNNRIGVAPGATWVAANGCCFSDASLIGSGEWMLAPTDLAGEDPDPSLRPHVINNSWGSTEPTNDPFMEDVSQAWAAAGQFGVWANGNSGPGCETSGSPGSRTINYSVGNYDEGLAIEGSSSRGAGQDGETKPNVSAPGTDVRSSVPGGDYLEATGTSMASPHVAGTVALLWSAAPALVGDVEATRELLDGTAVDSPDDQCGGTDEDNNVFGEGRLDALALLDEAPIGDAGRLLGRVSDAATGEPVAGAEVLITGPATRTVRTATDGTFGARLLVGDYTVTADLFGYEPGSTEVEITLDGETSVALELTRAPSTTVSGTVTDGSGQGWPLYAALSVPGAPALAFTDPTTGAYSIQLPQGRELDLVATAQYPGYRSGSQTLTVTPGQEVDFALPVDIQACVAPGYAPRSEGSLETFDTQQAPPGWTVEDYAGNGEVWVFDDPGDRGNQTGGEGGFAILDSDFYGPGTAQDSALVSPVLDFRDEEAPVLRFRQSFVWLGDVADVDVSLDGGGSWETVQTFTAGHEGPEEVTLALPMAAGESDVTVRFRLSRAEWTLFWQVDDVFVGGAYCDPVPGSLVLGTVTRTLDGEGVSGARVSTTTEPVDSGTSRATPADEDLADGFYSLFTERVGEVALVATARNYASQEALVQTVVGEVVRADFVLASGQLSVDPAEVATEQVLGGSVTTEVEVTNTGDAPVTLTFGERGGGFELAGVASSLETLREHPASGRDPEAVQGEISVAARPELAAKAAAAGPGLRTPLGSGTQEEPWVDLPGLPVATLDHSMVSLDGVWYSLGGYTADVWRYDPEVMEWSPAPALPQALAAAAAEVVDGRIVVTGGWTEDGVSAATWVFDPGTQEWTPGAEAPFAASAQGHAVLQGELVVVGGCSTLDCEPMLQGVAAYDVAQDSWTELAAYPVPVAFASCAPVSGEAFCAGGVNSDGDLSLTHALDGASGEWAERAPAPVTVWGSASAAVAESLVLNGGITDGEISNASWVYDGTDDQWSSLPPSATAAYRGAGACGFVRSGGTDGLEVYDTVELLPGLDECSTGGAPDVPWLEVSPEGAELAPGRSATVEVTTRAVVAQPGRYDGALTVTGNLPDGAVRVPVLMDVLPPAAWGKLLGTVSGSSCEGDLETLPGAGVTIDPTGRPEHPGWFLEASDEGSYATWFDSRVGEVLVTATRDGYRPDAQTVTVPRGAERSLEHTLLLGSCAVDPTPLPPEITRLAGADRYLTSVQVARQWEPGVSTVFLATGADYPDALAGAARAGALEVPLLLTRTGSVPAAVRSELQRLDPDRVTVLGGRSSVSAGVVDQVRAALPGSRVDRIAGRDRYHTAALVAQRFRPGGTVYVASGEGYADALAAAAVAGGQDDPVLLVRRDSLPGATRAALEQLDPDRIVLMGGRDAVVRTVGSQLRAYAPVTRIAGEDRYETAALLLAEVATAADVLVASGATWPDALTGAALAGRWTAPMLLTRPDAVPDPTWATAERMDPATVWLLGGEGAIQDSVARRLAELE